MDTTGATREAARFHRTVLGTVCLPWTPDWTLDERRFRATIARLCETVPDLYLFGTAGEGYAVSDPQFDQAVDVFAETLAERNLEPMVGLIGLATTTMRDRIERCLAKGVSLFQFSLPSWGPLNGGELERFFEQVCGAYPNARFVHYNVARSGRMVDLDEYAALAVAHENLVAVKHTAADPLTLATSSRRVPQLRHFFTEFAYAAAATLDRECALLVSVASMNPALALDLFRAGCESDGPRLREYVGELADIALLLRSVSGPGPHMDGAFDKMFHRVQDPDFPLALLPPYEGVSAVAFDRFVAAVRARHPRWLPPHRTSPPTTRESTR